MLSGVPDWTGKAVAIIASGPSVKRAEVEALKGRLPVLAIKANVELAPFAEVVYGCDYPWWRSVRGLPDFKGLKLSYAPRQYVEQGVQKIEIPEPRADRLLMGEVGKIGAGGSSGFQALNLALQFGARRVLLLGFDAQDRSGVHWYGRNIAQGMSNPMESNFKRWRAAFLAIVPQLAELGAEVINASPISDIKAFPRRSVEDALAAWEIA